MAKKKKIDLIFNPQQLAFIEYFFNPKSETYSNRTQSGIKAGFDEKYIQNIATMDVKWFDNAMDLYGDKEFLDEIDEELKKIVKMDCIDNQGVINPSLFKIKQDTLKFLAERLNKNKYSTKQEIDLNAKGNIIISFEDAFSERK